MARSWFDLFFAVLGAEFGRFVPIAANGHAAPLAAMALGCVVEIDDAIHAGAAPEIVKVC